MLRNYDAKVTDFAEGQTVRYLLAGGGIGVGTIGTISAIGKAVWFTNGDWCYIWDIVQ